MPSHADRVRRNYDDLSEESNKALQTIASEIKCNSMISSAAVKAWKYLEEHCYLVDKNNLITK